MTRNPRHDGHQINEPLPSRSGSFLWRSRAGQVCNSLPGGGVSSRCLRRQIQFLFHTRQHHVGDGLDAIAAGLGFSTVESALFPGLVAAGAAAAEAEILTPLAAAMDGFLRVIQDLVDC